MAGAGRLNRFNRLEGNGLLDRIFYRFRAFNRSLNFCGVIGDRFDRVGLLQLFSSGRKQGQKGRNQDGPNPLDPGSLSVFSSGAEGGI